jgi:hypothetical protein
MDDTEMSLWLQASEDDETTHAAQAAFGVAVAMTTLCQQQQAHQLSSRHMYLVWANLLPNLRFRTPWQCFYQSKCDCGFTTMMGFDVTMFHTILDASFTQQWCTMPIPCTDVNPAGQPCLNVN